MSRHAKNKKNLKIKDHKKSLEIKSFIFVLFLVFSVSFASAYFLTTDYIKRKSSVSLEEEADNLSKTLNINDLNNLYKDQDNLSLHKEEKETLKTKLKNEGKSMEEINKILETYRKYPVVLLGYHQVREYKSSDGPKTKLFITLPATFEKEMKYLFDNGYKTITTEQYINYLNNSTSSDFAIPEKSVVISFDDGYISQYEIAYPILKKYNMIAEFFIYKDCIDKYPACMKSNDLKELVNNNMNLGNHTQDHILLTKYKDETIIKQITENQNWLINNFGTSSVENILAYPYGASDGRVRNITKSLGYMGAIGVSGGHEKDNSNLFSLHRYLLGDNYELFERIFK